MGIIISIELFISVPFHTFVSRESRPPEGLILGADLESESFQWCLDRQYNHSK